ncbi:flagellar motor protein MotB [Nocardioides panacisoli]|uniref:Flagellar motor protein MotB n=1 Tax=Nocardioides panacisoli TaxID=627624 RepID=A0ABP7HQ51_9ACTN
MAHSTGRRRPHHEEEEAHENHERWLVTYADMVTLLMVLFIIMFAMSTVDANKFASLKEGLASGFGKSVTILNGADPMRDDTGATGGAASTYDMLVQNLPASQQAATEKVLQSADQLRNQRSYEDAKAEVKKLLALWRKVQKALERRGLQDDVQASVDERGLILSLVSRHVIFQPNIATLTPRGEAVVDTVAPILAHLTEPLEIDGHTNQEPVKPKYYPTDWELSVARAVNVLHRLQEHDGLPAKRLRATGFGHTKPLIDPSKPGSQRINKRVDIVILSGAPAEARARFRKIYQELT